MTTAINIASAPAQPTTPPVAAISAVAHAGGCEQRWATSKQQVAAKPRFALAQSARLGCIIVMVAPVVSDIRNNAHNPQPSAVV